MKKLVNRRKTRDFPYVYNQYDTQGSKRVLQDTIGADSPKEAIKKAGFEWVTESGGHIEMTRKGKGYTNTFINIYLPEDVASNSKPSFVLERVFN